MNRPSAAEIESIYHGIELRPDLPVSVETWNSSGEVFGEVIFQTQPKVLLDVGSHDGGSAIRMAGICKERNLDTLIFAMDVWYGRASDHIGHLPDTMLPAHWSVPSRYERFLRNVKAAGHSSTIIPVCNFTQWGAKILAKWEVVACGAYIDAGHEKPFALGDMRAYWPLIRPGGIMFGDDIGYPGVVGALGEFGMEHNLSLGMVGHHWFFRKP